MAFANSYEHKKFDLKTHEYKHKKFGVLSNKRKYEEEKENLQHITAQLTILERGANETQQQLSPAKRRQTKPLFRPWLEQHEKKPATTITPKVLAALNTNVLAHQQANKKLSELKQQRCKSNNLAEHWNQQNIKTTLYLRHLHELTLQRQGQLLVFGQ